MPTNKSKRQNNSLPTYQEFNKLVRQKLILKTKKEFIYFMMVEKLFISDKLLNNHLESDLKTTQRIDLQDVGTDLVGLVFIQ